MIHFINEQRYSASYYALRASQIYNIRHSLSTLLRDFSVYQTIFAQEKHYPKTSFDQGNNPVAAGKAKRQAVAGIYPSDLLAAVCYHRCKRR